MDEHADDVARSVEQEEEEEEEVWALLECYRALSQDLELKHLLAVEENARLLARSSMLWRLLKQEAVINTSLRREIVALKREVSIVYSCSNA